MWRRRERARTRARNRNAKKHIIQILDSSHADRNENENRKECLFRFLLLFAIANCVRVMRKRGTRTHTHTPSERLFVRIRQERCNCVESFVFAVAERARAHTHTQPNGWDSNSRFRVAHSLRFVEFMRAQINLIYAGCRLPPASSLLPIRLLVFASTATLFRSVCIHSMGDGIVIEYLFRIIHHHDILFRFRCGSDGNGSGGGDVDFQYHEIMIFAFRLVVDSLLFYFILFTTNEWMKKNTDKKKTPKSEFRITR